MWKLKILGLLFLCLLTPVSAAVAGTPLAVLPFLDVSRDPNGLNLEFTRYIMDRLTKAGTETKPMETVISFLDHNRIRTAGQPDTFLIKQMQEDLGVSYVLYGSVVQNKETEKVSPSFGVTLMLVRAYDGKTIWSHVGAVSAADNRKPLGVGEAASVADLQSLIGDEIVAAWPGSRLDMETQDTASIDTVIVEPQYVKPGTEIHGSVRLRNVWPEERAPKVFFKVEDQVYAAAPAEGGRSWEATWIAGEKDGRFLVSLLLEWPLYGRKENLQLSSYIVDGVAPLVDLDLKGEILEGARPVFRDEVIMVPRMILAKPIIRWRVTFKNSLDYVVAAQERHASLPERFTWDGRNFEGTQEGAGSYQVILDVWDEAGNTSQVTKEFDFHHVSPKVKVVAEKNAEGVVVGLQRDDKIPLAYWRLEMWSEEGKLLKNVEGKDLPIQVDVKLGTEDQGQKIQGVVVMQDILGNKGQQQIIDLFPQPVKEETETRKTSTEAWVNDF